MNNLEKEFVPYDLALRLKVLGFEESCLAYYESQDKNLVINYNNLPLTEEQKKKPGLYTIDNRNGVLPQWAVAAPTYQQAFRWFREKYNLVFNFISYNIVKPGEYHWSITWNDEAKASGIVKTYEEAEQSCLEKLIEIVESKSK